MKLPRFLKITAAAKMLTLCTFLCCGTLSASENLALRIGVVDFRECIENSAIGKHEQGQLDKMRGDMERMIEDRQEKLEELTKKISDPDHIDSLSPEAEAELKQQYTALTQQMAGMQQQYFQLFNQAQLQIVAKLQDLISEASEEIAKQEHLSLVLSKEAIFFNIDALDVTESVIKAMDALSPEQAQESTPVKSQ